MLYESMWNRQGIMHILNQGIDAKEESQSMIGSDDPCSAFLVISIGVSSFLTVPSRQDSEESNAVPQHKRCCQGHIQVLIQW
jgi:hypothetical protein